MSSDWPLVQLGDFVDSCLGKMLDQKKNKGSLQPYLGNSNVRWGRFEVSDLSYMRFEEHEKERYGLKYGDLVVCEGGEPGRCAIWKEQVPGMKIQKALHRIRPKDGLCNEFLYYWFLLAGKTGRLDPYFTGTTIKHLTGKALAELKIQLPPLSYQEKIAEILTVLDDKIAANRGVNQTLEQIAQTLFKSWFVDFDPVKAKIAALQAGGTAEATEQAAIQAISGKGEAELATLKNQHPEQYQKLVRTAELFPSAMEESELGEIPEGWDISEIGNEVTVVGGGTPSTKKSEFWESGSIHWTTPKDMSNLADKVLINTERKLTELGLQKISSGLLPEDTVLMSSRAPVGYLALAKIPVAVNQGYIAMKCEGRLSPEFVIHWCESNMDGIKSRASGTTFAEISKKNFKVIPAAVPSDELIRLFTKQVRSIYNEIAQSARESESLKSLRDTLLPKLLSGELTLPQAEAQLTETADV